MQSFLNDRCFLLRGAGMAQWWERSFSTNVARVWYSVLVSYVSYLGWVCSWLLSLLRGFFSGYSGFSPSIKTNISKFQFDLDVKCLHMSPWLGRLSDYSLHYDVKFDLTITDFLTSYIRPMCSCCNKKVCSKLPITLATATTIAHLWLPQLTVTHRGLYTHLVL